MERPEIQLEARADAWNARRSMRAGAAVDIPRAEW
jgi:hypothetical protein